MARLSRIKTNQTPVSKPVSKLSIAIAILTLATLAANIAVLAKMTH